MGVNTLAGGEIIFVTEREFCTAQTEKCFLTVNGRTGISCERRWKNNEAETQRRSARLKPQKT
jgi:hypothetical protein